jgi:hypothetical protein
LRAASRKIRERRRQRGGALLAVMWLSAALSAIVFSLAATTRAELERAGRALDAARAYYLAQGAVERFALHLVWAPLGDPRTEVPGRFRPGRRRMRWEFPSGVVDLEVMGESGKLNLHVTPPQALARLFTQLGVEGGRANQLVTAIVARRSAPPLATNPSLESTFSPAEASFSQLEDLLTVGGMTPDIYYGWWERDDEGRLLKRSGVAQHLTLVPSWALDVNYASPEVLRAVGVPEGALGALLEARESQILAEPAQLTRLGSMPLPAGVQLGFGGSLGYTVRATAQLKDRPVRRSVEALVRLGRDRSEPPISVIRWYQTAN